MRVNEDANLPYSLFEFIKLGKEGQIRNFGTSTDSYLEAAFSYSFPLMDDRLYIGIRGKFLAGLARAQVTYDRFDISLREDRWAVLTQGTLDLTAAGAKVETRTPTARPSRSAISTSNPPNPQDTALPSTWAPRTTSCPTCKRRWP